MLEIIYRREENTTNHFTEVRKKHKAYGQSRLVPLCTDQKERQFYPGDFSFWFVWRFQYLTILFLCSVPSEKQNIQRNMDYEKIIIEIIIQVNFGMVPISPVLSNKIFNMLVALLVLYTSN